MIKRSVISIVLSVMVVTGLIGVGVFGWYCVVDWIALQSAYHQYEVASISNVTQKVVSVAEYNQNIHRLNLFAEGCWTLLSAIICSIGLTGNCICSSILQRSVASAKIRNKF